MDQLKEFENLYKLAYHVIDNGIILVTEGKKDEVSFEFLNCIGTYLAKFYPKCLPGLEPISTSVLVNVELHISER